MAGRPVVISILADTKKAQSAISQLANDTGLAKVGKKFSDLGKTIATGLAVGGAALAGFSVKAIHAASDLEQSLGGVEAVFGKWAGSVKKYSETAATDYGISQAAFLQYSTLIGSQLKNLGIPMDEIGGKTKDLIGMASDLAATYGGTSIEAIEALSAAFRGEYDALERYGYSFKQADVNARMAAQGLTEAEAIMSLIEEQGAAAHGQFGREANTFAGQVQRLKAQIVDFAAAFGSYLLPAATAVVKFLSDQMGPAIENFKSFMDTKMVPAVKQLADSFTNDLLPVLKEMGEVLTSETLAKYKELADWITGTGIPAFKDFAQWVQENQTWLLALTSAVAGTFAALKTLAIIQQVTAWVNAVAGALKILWGALAANPIGLVVAAIGALVGALVYFFTQTETGKEIWATVWGFIKDTAAAVADWFTGTVVPAFQIAWQAITDAASAFADWFGQHVVPVIQAGGELIGAVWEAISLAFQVMWSVLEPIFQAIADRWNEIWNFIKSVWDLIGPVIIATIKGAFEQLKIALEAIWNAIKAVIETVLGVIRGIIQVITGLIKGDWSKVWEGIKNITSSIWDGIKSFIKSAIDSVKNTINNVLETIKSIWNSAWQWVKDKAKGKWDEITGIFSGAVGFFKASKE